MDLEDLKADWARRDVALAAAIRLNSGLVREALAQQRIDRVREAGAMRGFALASWMVLVALLGLYCARTFGEWEVFVPGLLLDIWTIAMGVITLREREALRAVDFGQPPLEIQQELARLRIGRARTVKWAFLTGQILWWIPLFIVLFRGLLGVNLFMVSDFMPKFIAVNLIAGLAFIPLALFAGRLIGPRAAGSRFAGAFLDAITGRDMAEARAIAGRMARFQEEAVA